MSTTFTKSTVRTVDTLTDIMVNFVTMSLALTKITVVGFNVVHCSFYAYIYCVTQCIVFRKAYILSGSGFHEILYSIIESFLKNREIAEFIPNQLRFHEKKL